MGNTPIGDSRRFRLVNGGSKGVERNPDLPKAGRISD